MSVDSIKDKLADREDAPAPSLKQQLEQASLVQMLEQSKPGDYSVDRLQTAIWHACKATPKLLECTFESIAGATLTMAQVGLYPGAPLNHCWLIPRNRRQRINGNWTTIKEAHFQLGWTGVLELARRSRTLGTPRGDRIHEGELVREVDGSASELVIERQRPRPTTPPVAYFVTVPFTDGSDPAWKVMDAAEIEAHAQRHAPKDDDGNLAGAWASDYDTMAVISVFRSMRNWLPLSTDLHTALDRDGQTLSLHTPRGGNDPAQLVEVSPAVPSSAVELAQESAGQPPLDLPDDQVPPGEPFKLPEPGDGTGSETTDGSDPDTGATGAGSEPEVDYDAVTIARLAAYHQDHKLASLGIPAKVGAGKETKPERVNRIADALDMPPVDFIALVKANEPPPPIEAPHQEELS